MAEPVYYHGGVPHLGPGDKILPLDVTRNQMALQRFVPEGLDSPALPGLVYLTTGPDGRWWAGFYARAYPRGGWVYRVRPDGPVEPDPDCKVEGLSVQCESATVVSVLKRGTL
jgi:hypothetical protein